MTTNLIGKKIICRGVEKTIAEVISAVNYGRPGNSDWYIEGRDQNGESFYWKQGVDGGELVDVDEVTQ